MDEEKFKQWEDELERRREEKQERYKRKGPDEREPGPDSCFAKTGGRTRHGQPCLMAGKPEYGWGCHNHPVEGYEGYEAKIKPWEPGGRPESKVRTAHRWAVLQEIMDQGTLEDFVQSLSPEELARGQIKGPDGNFKGRPPKWVPRAFMQACVKELMRRGRELYQENYVDAIRTMIALAHDPDIEGSVRLRAAQFVIERIEGKAPEKILVEVKDSFSAKVEEMEAAMAEDEQLQRVRERYSATEEAAAQ